MRILHISSEKSWRGGEQQIAYLIKETISQGAESSVLVREDSAFHDWLKKENIEHRTARFKNSFDFLTARSLKRMVSETAPDLIHVHSGNGHGIYALAHLFGLRTPCILSRRVDFPIKKNPWSRFKFGLPSIKRILTVSNAIAEMIKPDLAFPERVQVVHSGIDLERFKDSKSEGILRQEFGIHQEIALVGNTSALAPHKDYETFLKACKLCKEKGLNAKYLIIGSGPEENSIRQMIGDFGLNDDVIMTGFRADIAKILPELDLFLITSKTEGLGTSILDAFACEVPVVATRAGGIPELVKHEETGLLCPIQDSQALADAAVRILSNEELRSSLILSAKKSLSDFSKERTAILTMEVYREVLEGA